MLFIGRNSGAAKIDTLVRHNRGIYVTTYSFNINVITCQKVRLIPSYSMMRILMLISKFISAQIPTDQSRGLSEKPILRDVTYKSTISNSTFETGTLEMECCSQKCIKLIVAPQCVISYKTDFLKGHMIGQFVVIKVNMSHAYLKKYKPDLNY